MELVSEWSEGGNMGKDDDMIGTMSNWKQVMEHVPKCGDKRQ